MSGAACVIIIDQSRISTLDPSYELEGKLRGLYGNAMILKDLVGTVSAETIEQVRETLAKSQYSERDQEFLKETLLTF